MLGYRETGTIGSVEHLTSPMNDDPNLAKTCRITKETNAAIKAALPVGSTLCHLRTSTWS